MTKKIWASKLFAGKKIMSKSRKEIKDCTNCFHLYFFPFLQCNTVAYLAHSIKMT